LGPYSQSSGSARKQEAGNYLWGLVLYGVVTEETPKTGSSVGKGVWCRGKDGLALGKRARWKGSGREGEKQAGWGSAQLVFKSEYSNRTNYLRGGGFRSL